MEVCALVEFVAQAARVKRWFGGEHGSVAACDARRGRERLALCVAVGVSCACSANAVASSRRRAAAAGASGAGLRVVLLVERYLLHRRRPGRQGTLPNFWIAEWLRHLPRF
jgi:hypothetical protein